MKLKELKELGVDALKARETELLEELSHLRFRRGTGQLSNPMKSREDRRELARVKTLLRQRGDEEAAG